MYFIKTENCFDSAHFLLGHGGKCKNIHGHRWRIIIEVMAEKLMEDGASRAMLCDFSALKEELKRETDFFDHSFIVEKGSLKEETLAALKAEDFKITEVDFRPTAEKFAEYFYKRFVDLGYNVKEAVVYETPNNCAAYSEGF